MFARDRASQSTGMELLEVRAGYARIAFTVREDMLNGHDLAHGGFIFALVDSAFAYACNARNYVTVATGADIIYPASGRLGDLLAAVAEERYVQGRNGVTDVTITTQSGTVVALFRGQSRRIEGSVVMAG